MKYLNKYFEISKKYKSDIFLLKFSIVIITNIWLLLIFWKIILLNDMNIINNNILLNKASNIMQPVLQILGIDILSPNILKMIVITSIIVISNLAVLYFSQMLVFLILGITVRYSYKSYINYTNNKDLNYFGFENIITSNDKLEILNNYLKFNNIKLSELKYQILQDKILLLNNKNDINNTIIQSILEFKQESLIIKNEILQQEIINIKESLNKNTNMDAWFINSIDTLTIIKWGSIILIGVIIIGGSIYYIFNNNAVDAAGKIGKASIENTEENAKIILNSTSEQMKIIGNHMGTMNNSLIDLNKSNNENTLQATIDVFDNLKLLNTKIQVQQENINLIEEQAADNMTNYLIKNQIDHTNLNMQLIQTIEVINKNANKALNDTSTINNNIELIKQNIDNLNITVNGGITYVENPVESVDAESNLITNMVKEEIAITSIRSELKDIVLNVSTCIDSIHAILTFLNLDNLDLSQRALGMLRIIRRANIDLRPYNDGDGDNINEFTNNEE